MGLIYGHQEWGVIVEVAAVMGLDPGPENVLCSKAVCVHMLRHRRLHGCSLLGPGITIEGLCFDAFAASEEGHLIRKALGIGYGAAIFCE